MTITNVIIKPGVNAEYTPALNEAGISASNLIRFKAGLVQKYGGWVKFVSYKWASAIRAIHPWEDLSSVNHLGVGSQTSLDVVTNSQVTTITPNTLIDNVTPNFTTTAGSTQILITDPGANVSPDTDLIINTPVSVGGLILFGSYDVSIVESVDTYAINAATPATSSATSGGTLPLFTTTAGLFSVSVTFPNHGYAVGQTISFPVATTVGGLVIQGLYVVTAVNSANSFSINSATAASTSQSVSMNNGLVQFIYYIVQGAITQGSGYGVGGYGTGGYGFGITLTPRTGTPIAIADWTLDNFGKFLMAVPYGGPLFQWSPDSGLTTATLVTTAPTANGGVFLSMPAEILVLWGASVAGVQDPLLVAWCQPGDFTVWTATVTNQAGSFRLPRGSRIIGGIQGPLQGLIWTDLAIWSMSYIGTPFVFSFNEIAAGCGLIGRHAMGVVSQNVYWMSQANFFVLPAGGNVSPIPCPIWDVVFQNLNTKYAWKIQAAANSQFEEIAWFYPSVNSTENDSYVKYNVTENAWDYGLVNALPRTAWTDQSIFGPPIGGSPDGYLYQHEVGYDADTQPMDSWFETGYWAMSETDHAMFTDQIFCDMKWGPFARPTPLSGDFGSDFGSDFSHIQPSGVTSAAVQLTLYGTLYPNATPRSYGPFTMTSSTNFIEPKVRGRLIRMKIESNDLGSFWRMGNLRYRVQQDGRR